MTKRDGKVWRSTGHGTSRAVIEGIEVEAWRVMGQPKGMLPCHARVAGRRLPGRFATVDEARAAAEAEARRLAAQQGKDGDDGGDVDPRSD